MLKLKRTFGLAFGSINTKSMTGDVRQGFSVVSRVASMLAILVVSGASFAQIPFTEDFSTTTLRDDAAGQTTANWDTGSMQLLLPSSAGLTGTFDETTTVEAIAGSFTTRSVALADLDGDGDLDLIDGTNGRVGVQLNDGTGNFGNRVFQSPVTGNTRSVRAADMDHDGDIDFVAANNSGPIRLYVNDGTGTSFAVQPISSSNSPGNDIALVDIDGDGLLDVVVANISNRRNQIFLNTGDPQIAFGPGGQAGINIRNSVRESSRMVATGDIDNDGDMDIVFVNENLANPFDAEPQHNRVHMNQLAQGAPMSFLTFEIEFAGVDDGVGFSMDGELGDLNGDGYLDLVVVNYFDGEASKIYFNNATGTVNANPFTTVGVDFTSGASPSNPVFARAASLADADNDGDLDIFLTSSSVDFRNRIYTNDGGTFAVFTDVGPVNQVPLADPADIAAVATDSAVGDVDGDGDLDWVVGNEESLDFSGPLQNILLRNAGVANGTPAVQLSARATSLSVDGTGITSVRMNPAPATSTVGLQFHNSIEYWVTGNGGLNWSHIQTNGRPVSILAGTDVRWRANLNAMSALNAPGLALMQLDIAENATGPVLGVAIGTAEVTEGDDTTGLPIVPDFSDADGDTIYYSVSGLPDGTGLAIDPLTGEISGTPTNEDTLASVITVIITASDGSLTAMDTFALTVGNFNDGPNFTSTEVTTATQDVLYSYAITADDPDLDPITFSAPTVPAWLALVDNGDGTATLSGTPTLAEVGDHTVKLEVTDGGLVAVQNFVVSVAGVNGAPAFTSTPVTAATEDLAYSYAITVVDPDMDGVTIIAPTLPAWLTFSDNGDGTATLAGTPTGAEIGDHTVDLQAQEAAPAAGLTADQSFVITVAASTDGPVITITGAASVTVTVGNTYTDSGATASDPQDGDLTDQIVVDNPVNTNIAATYTVTYTVQDSAGNMAQAQRTVIVRAAPTPPPPPPASGGGGSAGIVELLIFALFTLACGAIRRRRPGLVGNRAV